MLCVVKLFEWSVDEKVHITTQEDTPTICTEWSCLFLPIARLLCCSCFNCMCISACKLFGIIMYIGSNLKPDSKCVILILMLMLHQIYSHFLFIIFIMGFIVKGD